MATATDCHMILLGAYTYSRVFWLERIPNESPSSHASTAPTYSMSFRKPVPYPYLTVNPYDPLLSSEKEWQKRCTFLEQCGYQLRPRYRPDWVPSWQGSSKALEEYEDSIVLSVSSGSYDDFDILLTLS